MPAQLPPSLTPPLTPTRSKLRRDARGCSLAGSASGTGKTGSSVSHYHFILANRRQVLARSVQNRHWRSRWLLTRHATAGGSLRGSQRDQLLCCKAARQQRRGLARQGQRAAGWRLGWWCAAGSGGSGGCESTPGRLVKQVGGSKLPGRSGGPHLAELLAGWLATKVASSGRVHWTPVQALQRRARAADERH